MLRVDLGRLRREGHVAVEARVPADDELWRESEFAWADDVTIRLTASFAGTGEVVVRGTVEGALNQECRRCLTPVTSDVDEEITLVFVSGAEGGESGAGDSYAFEPDGAELDLSEAVREEMILTVSQYAVCDPECRGLCPKCGANLNEGACDCTHDEIDPRWEALRILKDG